jgi:hypothetical protein
MKYDYKRLLLRTNKDISKAENYLNKGWKIISFGFNTILLEKQIGGLK